MKRTEKINTVFIGYDPREKTAATVLEFLIRENSPKPINVKLLRKDILERMGLYYRKHSTVNEQDIDSIDMRPFSTEFSLITILPMPIKWMASNNLSILEKTGQALCSGIVVMN